MKFNSKNSFKSLDNISSSGKEYKIFNLKIAEKNGLDGISKLPKSLKVLLENLLRYEDDITVDRKQILAIKEWLKNKKSNTEIACLLYTSPSPRDLSTSRMPSSA